LSHEAVIDGSGSGDVKGCYPQNRWKETWEQKVGDFQVRQKAEKIHVEQP
jgi:hypothetical protein